MNIVTQVNIYQSFYQTVFMQFKKMKRKIYFDPKYRKLKKYRLMFYCPLFDAQLSGCDLGCNICPAEKYKEKEENGTSSNNNVNIADSS